MWSKWEKSPTENEVIIRVTTSAQGCSTLNCDTYETMKGASTTFLSSSSFIYFYAKVNKEWGECYTTLNYENKIFLRC